MSVEPGVAEVPDRARVALSWRILGLDYPAFRGAWLKVFSVVRDDPAEALRVALRDEFPLYTPESAPYGVLNAASWLPVDRGGMVARVEEILGGCRTDVEDLELFVDVAALRRWFTTELWGAGEVSWSRTEPAGREPAVAGVDGVFVVLLWLS